MQGRTRGTRLIHIAAMMLYLCMRVDAGAGALTAASTVSRIGPEGGIVNSLAVDPKDSNTVYAASAAGVFKSSNGGTTWSYSGLMGFPVVNLVIKPERPATIYASAPGILFKSLDAGATWNQLPGTPPNLILLAIDPQNQDTLFATIRPAGGLFESNDGGANWFEFGSGIPNGVLVGFAIDPDNTSTLYITTTTSVIKSTDGGESWSAIYAGPCCVRGPLTIDPQNSMTLYVESSASLILKSTDAGRDWTVLTNSFHPKFLTVDPQNSNTLYAATYDGTFKSTDGGVSWSVVNTGFRAMPVVSAAIDPQNPDVLYAGTGLLFKSNDRGRTWAVSGSGIRLEAFASGPVTIAIDPQTPDTLYAGTGGDECGYGQGGVFKSLDGGKNWADTGLISCLAALAIDPQTPGTIYAGTWYRGMLKSIDGGASWTEINVGLVSVYRGMPAYISALALDSKNPQILYAGVVSVGFGSYLFKSIDAGMTWNPTALSGENALVSAVIIDSQIPGTVYVVTAPYGSTARRVWKSTDGGANWQDLSAGLPSAAYTVAVDPKDSATIYAGTDLGVFRSADGGQSWMLLTATTGSTHLLVPGADGSVYAGGPEGLFAISPTPQPTVTAVIFDRSMVSVGGSYATTIAGTNLSADMSFDVQAHAPGTADDIVVFNWQTGTFQSHSLPAGIAIGTWTIDGVRAHQDPGNHTGSFVPVSAAITVSP
jgi:photosystem II stability/assembly factor-like uncharacterized protein